MIIRIVSRSLLLLLAGSFLLGQTGHQLPVNDTTLPKPYATPSANNSPRVVPQPDGAQLSVPSGFNVGVWADGFSRPRFMLLGPSGEILLSDSSNEGKVYVLQDSDGDGTADSKRILVEGMYRPYGLAFWKDYLYVAGTTGIKRWHYNREAMQVQGEGETIASWPDFQRGHWTRSIVFSPDGKTLYATIGSQSNVDSGEDPMRAAINTYYPDGSNHRIFAAGLRNVIGLDFYPGTDQLWAAVQERDALGDDLVPDYFTTVNEGEFFGWPYAYTGPHADPRREGERPDLVQKTRYPDVLIPAHSAVLDAEFYTANQFPEHYRGGAFLAYHGSWNRAERTGYKVAFVPFRNGRPVSGPEDFLVGWLINPAEKEVWGRPVGILQLPDGSLLVSDDGGRKIWRVWYEG